MATLTKYIAFLLSTDLPINLKHSKVINKIHHMNHNQIL